jgi:hypothetical protein
VVELHVGDGRHAGIQHVGRVQAAAHPHLDQHQVDAAARQLGKGCRGQHLELGRGAQPLGHAVDGG